MAARRQPKLPRASRVNLIRKVVRGGGRNIKVVKFGQLMTGVVNEVVKASAIHLRVIAQSSADLLVSKLFAQPEKGNIVAHRPDPLSPGTGVSGGKTPFRHKKLTPAYARYKFRSGLDGRILIASGDYVNAIEVVRSETKEAGVTYRVRLKPGVHRSGMSFTKLGLIHEFGSARAHIPARPHWRPVGADVLRKFRRLPQSVTAEGIRKALSQVK